MNWVRICLALGVLGLVIVLMTACDNATPPPPTLPPPTLIPTPAPVPPSPTPVPPSATVVPPTTAPQTRAGTPTVARTATSPTKSVVDAAFAKALTTLKTYRVEVPQESRYIAVVLPDRFLQEGADSIIKIGGTVWAISPKGYRRGTGTPPYFERADINWYRNLFAQSPQVTLLGPGTAEEVPCIGYAATLTMVKADPPKTPGATPVVSQVPVQVKLWFAVQDGYPRRADFGAPMNLTVNFFDFNEPIVINPPQ